MRGQKPVTNERGIETAAPKPLCERTPTRKKDEPFRIPEWYQNRETETELIIKSPKSARRGEIRTRIDAT